VLLTGGNRHDSTQLIPLVEALPVIRGKRGLPWRRPHWLCADRAYDYDHHRGTLRCAGSWSVRSPGCTSSNGSVSGTSDAPTSIWAFYNWDAP
jgi:hypothetical protein